MARYTGPVCKLCRREGMKLFLKGDRCFSTKCAVERRAYAPGQHGQRRQRKLSDFGMQLREKQKARRLYGMMEKQFAHTFVVAAHQPGVTGDNMLRLLEGRLDNVVYRLGFADSRKQARQLVRHGHFDVNGRKTDIPSFATKVGDTIAVRETSKTKEYFKAVSDVLKKRQVPDWLSLDARAMAGKLTSIPEPKADVVLSEQLIVEYYSR